MKVQNEMSTRISVNAVSAIGSMQAFRNAIRGASDAWRAQETALRNSGRYSEAATTRLRGLNQVIDLQKAKVEELRQRQEGLDTSNKKQANQFLRLEKQIQSANKQLSSYESQATRARNAARYQVSGLASLQHAYRLSQSSSSAYVNRLQAEGRSATATVAKYRQLRTSLANLESQYRKQEFLLKQVANESGRDSEAYIKQREQLDKTATSIAKTRSEMKSLASENARLQPTGINRIDSAVLKLNDHTARLRKSALSAFDTMRSHAMAFGTTAMTVGAGIVSSANRAAAVQKVMVENQNLLTTAGEKAAASQKEVNRMYSDGAKYSVQYGVSQRTIANGYQELIKRGYDGRQALGAMKSILEASRASGDDFNDTMKVTTSTLEAFGMRSETTAGMMRNTAKAADVLAKAADVTSTSFEHIGVGMEYAGSSAKQSGVSMRETAAALGVLSNNGLEASQAGTGLQRIFTRLAAPTSTATSEMRKYNLSIDDFKDKTGNLRPVSAIFQDINKHVPKAERLEFFNKVFGQTAQNAAGILSRTASLNRENSQSLQHVEDQLKTAYSEDYVGKLARKNMNSAKNASDRFKYAAQAIQIEIGRNMLPAISRASQSMANAFGRKDTQEGLKTIAKGLGDVANAAVSLLTFIGRHTTTIKVFGAALLTAFGATKLLDAIGRTRRRINDLRAVLDKIPRKKSTTIDVDSRKAKTDVQSTKRELDTIPKDKRTTVTVDSKTARASANAAKRELDTIPKAKTTKVNVDSREAVRNLKTVGTTSQTVARASRLSFATIRTAGVSSIRAIGLAVRANPLGALITGVQLAVDAFQLLYNHSKTFRRFVNGLSSAARSGMRKVGNYFSSTFKNIGKEQAQANRQQQRANQQAQRNWNNHIKSLRRSWDNFWKNYAKTQQRANQQSQRANQQAQRNWDRHLNTLRRGWDNYWRNYAKTQQRGSRQSQRLWDNLNRRVSRSSSSMWKRFLRDSTTGWNRRNMLTRRGVQNELRQHNTMSNRIARFNSRMWDSIVKTATNGISSNEQINSNGLNTINSGWNSMWNGLKDFFSDIWDAIKNLAQDGMNAVINVINGGISAIDNVWSFFTGHGSGIGKLNKVHFAQGGVVHRSWSVVNDGPGENWKELLQFPDGSWGMSHKRNATLLLPVGTRVYNGEETKGIMNAAGIQHYATGGVVGAQHFAHGGFVRELENWVASLGNAMGGLGEKFRSMEDFLESPVQKVKGVIENAVGADYGRIGHWGELARGEWNKITDGMTHWVRHTITDFLYSFENKSLSRDMMRAAATINKLKPSDGFFGLLWQVIMSESGGRNILQQIHDVNSGGNEAGGILQYTPGTFAKYALPGHGERMNDFNQLLAFFNNTDWLNSIGSTIIRGASKIDWLHSGPQGGRRDSFWPHFANGGIATQPSIFGESGAEMAIPLDSMKSNRAWQLLRQVVNYYSNQGANTNNDSTSTNEVRSIEKRFDTLIEQNNALILAIEKLTGVTASANDPTARYKRTQRDINIAHAQSFV